jgi:hypothetical protein
MCQNKLWEKRVEYAVVKELVFDKGLLEMLHQLISVLQ